jgi:hypothetical protein
MSSAYVASGLPGEGGGGIPLSNAEHAGQGRHQRRNLLLQMQRPSTDELSRLDALEKLRELDGLAAAPPPGWHPTRSQAARRDQQQARQERVLQVRAATPQLVSTGNWLLTAVFASVHATTRWSRWPLARPTCTTRTWST